MSLSQRISNLSKNARRALLAQLAEKSNDIKVAKTKGINENGNTKLEVEGTERAGKGLGSMYLRENTKVFYDKTGSIEYKNAPEEEDAPLVKAKPSIPTENRIFPRNVVTDLFGVSLDEEEVIATGSAAFNVTVACGDFGLSSFSSDSAFWGTFSYTQTPITWGLGMSDYYGTGDEGGVIFEAAALLAIVKEPFPGSQFATSSATATYLNAEASEQRSPDPNAPTTTATFNYYAAYATPDGSAHTGSLSYSIGNTLTGATATATGRAFGLNGPMTRVFFKFKNSIGGDVIREIDLDNIVPGRIAAYRQINTYTKRVEEEGENYVYNYSIFLVLATSSSNSLEVLDSDGELDSAYHFPVKYYIVHTELNFNTGALQSKVTESTQKNDTSLVTGEIEQYTTNDLYLLDSYPAVNSGIHFDKFKERKVWTNFSPEAIWQKSFAGHWMYAFRNIGWDSVAAANISDEEVWKFCQCAFEPNDDGGIWSIGLNSAFQADWDVDNYNNSEFIRYYPQNPSNPYHNGQPYYGDYQDIENLNANIATAARTKYSDFFSGTFQNWTDYGSSGLKGPHSIPDAALYRDSKIPFYSYVPEVVEIP